MRQALVVGLQRRRLLLAIGECIAVQGGLQEGRLIRHRVHALLRVMLLVLQGRRLEGTGVELLLLVLAWEAEAWTREGCASTHGARRCMRLLCLLWRAPKALQVKKYRQSDNLQASPQQKLQRFTS